MRLNKYIAACGVCSRRKAEDIILSGRITVNGAAVCELAAQICDGDEVFLDGVKLALENKIFLVMNKPCGVVCAVSDERDRTILELLPLEMRKKGIFSVGRLDKNSEGLIILTNDGIMCNKIIHPSFKIKKCYDVKLNKPLTEEHRLSILNGIYSEKEFLRPVSVVYKKHKKGEPCDEVTVTLQDGKKREIRRLMGCFGYEVEKLVRVSIGMMELKYLKCGDFISLAGEELLAKITLGGCV